MKMLSKKLICVALTLALMSAVGCAKKDNDGGEGGSGSASSTTDVLQTGGEDRTEAGDPVQTDDPREIYTIPEEDKAAAAEENEKIVYTGFDGSFYNTPLDGETELAVAMPIFSYDGLHTYMASNDKFDFGEGEGSFKYAADRTYTDAFFNDKGLLVISFRDDDGGSGYEITGAWKEEVTSGEQSYDLLVIAVKKKAGDVKAGHLLVELDKAFLDSFDSYTVNFYEGK